MHKVRAFVRLDFVTVKPYFTIKNLIIYAVIAIFLTIMSGNPAAGVGVGMMLSMIFIGYPFALCEKNNMDALYMTLSVDRKTVVLGRYVFALLLNGCVILFSGCLGMAGLFILNAYRGAGAAVFENFELLFIIFGIAVFFLFIQSIQLPAYFKLGYSKSRLLMAIPFVAILIGYLIILRLSDLKNDVPGFLTGALNSEMIIPLLVLILLCIIFISYRLSLAFYKKREF